MKNGKKFLSLLLVMCLVVGLSNNLAFAVPTVGDFSGGKRKVTFKYTDDSASEVYVNVRNKEEVIEHWQMEKTRDGTWELTKEFAEGLYGYQFEVHSGSEEITQTVPDPTNIITNWGVSVLFVPGEVTSPIVNGNSVTINLPVYVFEDDEDEDYEDEDEKKEVVTVKVTGDFTGSFVSTDMKLDSAGKYYTATISNVEIGKHKYYIELVYSNGETKRLHDVYNMNIEIENDGDGNNELFSIVTVNAYTVSFDANGGSGSMGNIPNTVGNYKLPDNKFSAPTNKKFKGWADTSDGSGKIYSPGSNYYVNKNTTLYAVWEKLSTPTERSVFISKTELTEVPEGLKSTNFNTIEKIKNELIRAVGQKDSKYSDANAIFYDVKMKISSDGGKTWVEPTEADFPTEGITVKLPYPQGTGKDSHDFAVTHMFTVTSARLGTVAGETENPEVTKLDDSIQFTVNGLSPVVIAWKPATTTPSDSGTSEETKTPDNTITSDVQNNSNVLETQSALATSTGSDKAKDVKSDNSIDVLETGDNRIISLYIGTMIASLIGFISIVTIRKRNKKDVTK